MPNDDKTEIPSWEKGRELSNETSIGDGITASPDARGVPTDELNKPDSWKRIIGLPLPWFFLIFAIVVATALVGAMPNQMLPGFAVVILLGALIHWAGDRIPVLRNYGLPTVLCILLPAILLGVGLFPTDIADVVVTFTTDIHFLDFYVASLIAGSILGMPRSLLIKAGARFAVPLIGTIVVVFAVVGGTGMLFGFGLRDAILFVAGPVMGGGVGAGAVPMSQMYADQLGGEPGEYLGRLIPAVIVANITAIFLAGVFNGITYKGQQWFVGFNGEGKIVRVDGKAKDFVSKPRAEEGTFSALAVGLLMAATIYLFGQLVAEFVPLFHGYAWSIFLAAGLKISGVLPQSFEDAVAEWYGFVAKALTPALLVGVSLSYIELDQLGTLLTDPAYLSLVLLAVFVAILAAGAIGWLVKMYFAESAVAIGMGMTDMGGTGDVAVVSAANRLELMPFLQISSRIGGAFVLVLLSLLLPILA